MDATVAASPRARIICVVGPAGVGKTTLVQALATLQSPPTRGDDDARALIDTSPEERAHHHSVDLGVVRLEHRGHAMTLLDVPGIGELAAARALALAVADAALVVVPPSDSPSPELLRIWRELDERQLPRLVVVNRCDDSRCAIDTVVRALNERLEAHLDAVELVAITADGHQDLIDVLAEASIVGIGTDEHLEPLPEVEREFERQAHDALLDDIVAEDDALLERYLAGEELDPTELNAALAIAIRERHLTPVLAASATTRLGLTHLLDMLDALVPASPTPTDTTSALVIATSSDNFQGTSATLAIVRGAIRPDSVLRDSAQDRTERLHQLLWPTLPKPTPTTEAAAGDVVIAPKVGAAVGTWLIDPAGHDIPDPVQRPTPTYTLAVEVPDQRANDKVQAAAARLAMEDPGLIVSREAETHRLLLTGMGATHLALVIERLGRRSGAAIQTVTPRTPYRETIAGTVEVEGRHKKQTGGHGQYGVVVCRIGPGPRASGVVFFDEIVGGAIPRTFIPAVEAGIREACEQGGPHGFPVVDLEVHLIDGKHHPVDSNELSFKLAGALALRTALERAGSVVLEPIARVHLSVPASAQGDVLGYVTSRRGRIIESTPVGPSVEIEAELPAAELTHLAVDLHGLTAGQGSFTSTHDRYEPVPTAVLGRLLSATSK
ncbi:small GTP-binding protein [Acidimicrobium ferrooxidans DSM 10331]|uniref:Small GTP-binding protein n=1 Tax=Acidimicrobium ferrooxidans (strain DSM 10331 / JCM 15462 / NBRC 103882 / ICP) TaxID=525909 RepID=C7LZJ9_ACIFD|nr:GTP-binding protein [Acidimicrobium ferrooxidans]ACU54157.1 small GTP-binding protein [Acidimicrobium ferrooxidans DSM 10331]